MTIKCAPGLIAVGLSLSLWGVAASERPHFISKGLDGAITIDGRFDDWYGHLDPFGHDPLSVQFLNDGEFLYVRLTASDATARMQIRRLGMTIWFDPAGGTKKKFGIRYPVVEQGEGGAMGGRRGRGGDGPPPDDAAPPIDRVDILGPGKDEARSLTRGHLSGIDVAIHAEQGTLQYELRVPLARSGDRPYAIETAPGRTIGIGVETGTLQMRSFGTDRGGGVGGGGGMGGGGGRGRGGGMGGGGRGRGGQGRAEPPRPAKPLKPWATVTIGPVR